VSAPPTGPSVSSEEVDVYDLVVAGGSLFAPDDTDSVVHRLALGDALGAPTDVIVGGPSFSVTVLVADNKANGTVYEVAATGVASITSLPGVSPWRLAATPDGVLVTDRGLVERAARHPRQRLDGDARLPHLVGVRRQRGARHRPRPRQRVWRS